MTNRTDTIILEMSTMHVPFGLVDQASVLIQGSDAFAPVFGGLFGDSRDIYTPAPRD